MYLDVQLRLAGQHRRELEARPELGVERLGHGPVARCLDLVVGGAVVHLERVRLCRRVVRAHVGGAVVDGPGLLAVFERLRLLVAVSAGAAPRVFAWVGHSPDRQQVLEARGLLGRERVREDGAYDDARGQVKEEVLLVDGEHDRRRHIHGALDGHVREALLLHRALVFLPPHARTVFVAVVAFARWGRRLLVTH